MEAVEGEPLHIFRGRGHATRLDGVGGVSLEFLVLRPSRSDTCGAQRDIGYGERGKALGCNERARALTHIH